MLSSLAHSSTHKRMASNHPWRLLALFVPLLASCSDSNQNNATTTQQLVKNGAITLFYSKGPVEGASCQLFRSDATAISEVVRSAQGVVRFPETDYNGVIYAQCSGGSFIDEATGTTVTLDNTFTTRSLTVNAATVNDSALAVTPYTEVSFRRAENAGDTSPATMAEIAAVLADELGLDGIDIGQTIPTTLDKITGSSDSDRYGTALAALSQMQLNRNGQPNQTRLYYLVSQMVGGVNDYSYNIALRDLDNNSRTIQAAPAATQLLAAIGTTAEIIGTSGAITAPPVTSTPSASGSTTAITPAPDYSYTPDYTYTPPATTTTTTPTTTASSCFQEFPTTIYTGSSTTTTATTTTTPPAPSTPSNFQEFPTTITSSSTASTTTTTTTTPAPLAANEIACIGNTITFESGTTATMSESKLSTGYTAKVKCSETTTPTTTTNTLFKPQAASFNKKNVLGFTLTGGADVNRFQIKSLTGELDFIIAPDFEKKEDANGDNVYEVTIQASNETTTKTQTVYVTVTDLPTLSIANVALNEGNSGTSTITFTVNLSAASTQAVTFKYATSDLTATAGSDYTAVSGTATLAAGTTTHTITANINGDTTVESDETFQLTLSNWTNAEADTNYSAIATITSDDVTTLTGDYMLDLGDYDMYFKEIPAGTFKMGSPTGEIGQDSDEVQYDVTLTKAFYLGVTEVTQGQWQYLMGTNPAYFTSCGLNCPVENISRSTAESFITKLNALGKGTYSLPTEAEWEYAARAGTTTAFSNGTILTATGTDSNLNTVGWYLANSNKITHTVAGKTPNAWGLYDMHGNVFEWVSDTYGTYPTTATTDPTGAASGSNGIIRGGSWSGEPKLARSANREQAVTLNSSIYAGLRVKRAK
ncbi:MAG: SUMF1/EgtB/PvdO family nonheme iron enzyme [Gammaproteobacteria bacterium]|nr:SUMF1/EgtB/PvdO family nonheme iron enzyme [Gammaproteobacteria bacterium]